ncbi:hypothetical protein [Yersinia enterocolitica]|uniref:hypothetical protein n=1 Tax=Yersinia enterocolitica TaxID=630 RepID=UPI0002819728|nr:hypothetical protein [Yersinia enterocolitica]EKA28333.1 hypothetical protein YWA314_04848 [Yersinia enterocolitica subsp. enterocolitica WA-314]KGA74184.1 hypothetical protein DJ59_3232 [Yersinia enterocolitica]PNM11399.1 hypothetical protein A6J64_004235 [Yersinia enterocolitica]PNM18198.1 hypothetical protein A6J65_004420 [Yersinia enterocolitica]HDL7709264.1 hypothetical protein [Yersinia enterocolitica]
MGRLSGILTEIPADYRNQSKSAVESTLTLEKNEPDLDKLTTEAIKHNFDENVIGSHLLYISDVMGVNGAVAYSAIIAKAIISRKRKNS